jgi:hypothetical protein
VRSDAKKKKPAIISAIISRIKQGIAPWRGIAEVLLSLVFFLIFGAAIQRSKIRQHGSGLSCLFLEQAIKRSAGVIRVTRRLAHSVFASSTRCARRQRIARNCDARREELARVGLVLKRDA